MLGSLLRGDICDVEFTNQDKESHIQNGKRPCIIISNNKNNLFSPVVTVIPLTTSKSKSQIPTHVLIKKNKDNRLLDHSTALCESVCPVEKKYVSTYSIGKLDASTMRQIEKAINIHLGMTG